MSRLHRNCAATTVLVALLGLFAGRVAAAPEEAGELERIFARPPAEARPQVLWMWMGSNISRAGLTRDLEALHDAGYGGATLFSLSDTCTPWAGTIGASPTPEVVAFTAPWWELVRHAATEARRLHLDFGIHNCPGYESSGGPWITPEQSMQQLVWAETRVSGPAAGPFVVAKPQPDLRAVQPFPLHNPETGRLEKPEIPARRTFYRDVAVLAVPADGPIDPAQAIDLTGALGPDGTLAWAAPAGEWSVYRFGHTTNGKLLQPGQWAAIGLECDKMRADAVEFHVDHLVAEARRHLGALVGDGFNYYHFDSYEAGTPDWTPRMAEEFRARRGYPLTRFLPTFAQRVVGTTAETAKFRADFQQTVRDLYRENYFPVIARRLHAAGLRFMCEPYGGPWAVEEVVPQVDRIMTEFWTNGGRYRPYELAPTVAAVRAAGRNLVEAEAFTGAPRDSQWAETPAWLKAIGDAAFCDGVNRLSLHRFTHQPLSDRFKPGLAMGQWGTHFDRTQTWWAPGKAWVEYLARCQALLQWGGIVARENDFTVRAADGVELRAIHRRAGDTDVYFVANLARRAGTATCTFATSGRRPEWWDPVRGTRRPLPDFSVRDGCTTLDLGFADSESAFLVFREPAAPPPPGGAGNTPRFVRVSELSAPWTVRFDPAWGGPARVEFPALVDWSRHAAPGIRYYSGTATYECTFAGPAAVPPGARVWLDLGTVHDLAEVRLNGRELGVVWTAPWRVDLTAALAAADNRLEIRVTNTWANRLIGDEQEPADLAWGKGDEGFGGPLQRYPDWVLRDTPRPSPHRYTFTTWNYFSPDSPLRPSGLLGPVTLHFSLPSSP